jgi:iron complex transport system ATP-binding protein
MTSSDLEALRLFIAEFTAEGGLVITITHDLDLVRHSDRVVVLADGAVRADGPPDRILGDDVIDRIFTR